MISIPLYVFLFIYLIFLAVFAAFSMINVYHIVMSASFTLASFTITFFVGLLTVLTFYFTWYLLADVNWQQTLVAYNPGWLG